MTEPAARAAAPAAVSLPAALRLGAVHLTVGDVGRSVAWYQETLGLAVHREGDGEAALGAGREDLVVLHEDRGARPAGRHAGLYHYALLYPDRAELARAAVRLGRAGTRVQGASDHGTHEAIYLPDPDGNGIELAADRGRDRWTSFEEEFARGGPQPLDLDDLLGVVAGEEPADRVRPGLAVGHVHLHVGDLDQALAFYRDALGLELQARMDTAAFLSAGGYHHHLGINTWQGRGAGPPPADAVGLRHWTIVLPRTSDVGAVRDRVGAAGWEVSSVAGGFAARDPWGVAVHVVAADQPVH